VPLTGLDQLSRLFVRYCDLHSPPMIGKLRRK